MTALLAHPAAAQLRVGAGIEVIHKKGMAMASIAAGPTSFVAWDNDNYGIGLSYRFGPRTGWSGAVGGLYARRTDEDLGTRLNIALQASYCGKALCLSFLHLSHGSSFGIRRNSANSGLNFLYLEYRLDKAKE